LQKSLFNTAKNYNMLKEKAMLYFFLLFSLFFACCGDKNNNSEDKSGIIPPNEILKNFTALINGPDTLSDFLLNSTFNSSMTMLTKEDQLLLLEGMGEYFYKKEKPDTALKYYKDGLKLSNNLDDTYFQSVFHLLIGRTYTFISEFNIALEELRTAYDLSISLDSTLLLIRTARNLGNAYSGLGIYDKALDYYYISNDASEKVNNKNGIASALNNIGSVYKEVKDFDKAIEFSKKASKIAEAEGLDRIVAASSNNIGNIFSLRKMYDSAMIYFQQDLVIERRLNSKYNIGISLGKIADVYMKTGYLDKAGEYFNESFKNASEIGDKTGMATACLGLAESLIIGNKLNKAEVYLSNGFELSKEIGSLRLLDISYGLYSDYYYKKKDYKSAHKYLTLNTSIKDSINSMENVANVARHENQYKVTQKELEILRLKQKQKNYFQFLLIGFITFFVISIIIIYSYRQKIKTNRILSKKNLEIQNSKNELEKKHIELLKSQEKLKKIDEGKDDFLSLISHDLKNPLSAIRGFAELMINSYDELTDEQRKKFLKEIFDSIERLSLLINNILLWVKSQAKGLNILPVEFNLNKRVNDNIAIYSITATDKEIKIINSVSPEIMVLCDINIFDMVIRNLLSNALKFTHKKGSILISTEKTGLMVRLLIKDNGIGIPQDKIELILDRQKNYTTIGTLHEQGTGLGLGLVTEFIHKIGGRFDIISQPGKGTTVLFEIPSAD
jgi:two-component system, sensor histidine kinase and response regulator